MILVVLLFFIILLPELIVLYAIYLYLRELFRR